MEKQFVAYFWFVAWDCISLGFHISFKNPNIEIHLPFGFVRIGWVKKYELLAVNHSQLEWRGFGLMER